MPITAQMSLLGLYQYDGTILDGLNVPSGMDAGTVKDSLLMETASMEVLYPDVNFMKAAITVWSAERQDVWNRLYATTVLDYNPIENYDRMEESVSSNSGESTGSSISSGSSSSSDTGSTSGSSTSTDSRSSSERSNTVGSGRTSESGIASQEDRGTAAGTSSGNNSTKSGATAYNSNTFADVSQTESEGRNVTSNSSEQDSTSSHEKESSEVNSSATESNRSQEGSSLQRTTSVQENRSSQEGSSTQENNNRSTSAGTFRSRIHGNIGVTTSQQMIQSEREISLFCMTEFIVNDFISRFCIGVY